MRKIETIQQVKEIALHVVNVTLSDFQAYEILKNVANTAKTISKSRIIKAINEYFN